LCGNVGTPVIASDELSGAEKERSILVVEASSYQLEACSVMKPAVSVILNISENHLERHGSLERYAAAKARAMRLQDRADLCILNADDPVLRLLGQSSTATTAYFGVRPAEELSKFAPAWASISYSPKGADTVSLMRNGELEVYDLSSSNLLGLHNRYNVAAALLAVRAMDVSMESIREGLADFSPLEHRLEVVVRRGELTVINDSKSTTVAAAVAAVSTLGERFGGEGLVLMIGGLSKAGSWAPLFDRLSRYPGTAVVCFGKDGPLLASHCAAAGIEHVVAPTLEEATKVAIDKSAGKGVVLLTPGCASFDEFTDFEHRGAEFKRYVRGLVSNADPAH
jgi:UDP-N-acetylmuramoylalanine--D-glutamate ligase